MDNIHLDKETALTVERKPPVLALFFFWFSKDDVITIYRHDDERMVKWMSNV